MLQMRARVIAAVLAITATIAPPAAAQKPLPQHERLAAMAGTWDVELTFWPRPGAAGLTSRGTSTIEALLNKLFIQEKIEGTVNGAPFTTLALTGYNPSSLMYEATRFSSTNPARIVETGRYDDDTKRFELRAEYPVAGDTWHQRTVIQIVSADAMVAASYLSFGTVPEWKAVEIKYTRRGRSAVERP